MRALLLLSLLACGDNRKPPLVPCAANPFDPLRYQTLLSNGPGLTRDDARFACQQRAMDLAIFSDQQELDAAAPLTITPAWIDAQLDPDTDRWLAASGCSGYVPWEQTFPIPVDDPPACAVMDASHVFGDTACDDQSFDGQPITAFCETPYDGTCEARNELTFVGSDRIEAGRAACAHIAAHLVQIDSTEELADAEAVALASGIQTFWLDAVYVDNKWTTGNGCPTILPWAAGEPVLSEPPRCVIYDRALGGAETVRCDSVVTAVVCEAD